MFHGSLDSTITTFKPFSHFGTKLAALQAISKKIDANYKDPAILYEIEFDESKINLLQAEDWGSPGIIGTARGVRDALIKLYSENNILVEEIESIRANFTRKKNNQDASYLTDGVQEVLQFLIRLDYHGIKYINNVEGTEDSESICFMNSNQYIIKNKSEVNQNDIFEAQKLLRYQIIKKTG